MSFIRSTLPKLTLVLLVFLSACSRSMELTPAAMPTLIPPSPTATASATPVPSTLWIGEAVPDALREEAQASGLPLAFYADTAVLRLDVAGVPAVVNWTYALVAPFPTIPDGISGEDLRDAWEGNAPEPWSGSPLWMAESTQQALTALWGEAGSGAVRTADSDQLLETVWNEKRGWAIIPFESIQVDWKVLTIDGQSPLHNDFDAESYPLIVPFALICDEPCPIPLPELTVTNRDPEKLTTLLMTGVTALVRATAYKMEVEGINYPAQDIGDWLRDADIAHISNEIPFDPNCPPPNPNKKDLQFCSDPKYIELLEYVGADVIELTGNHFQDRGSAATLFTLELYNERGWPYYGGGADLADAQKPITMEHNGNKLAFIGCNPVGPDFAWARDDGWPGAAPCDFDYMTAQISQLREDGYLPIATFQYYEYYSAEPRPWQVRDFQTMADAGAVVVSGSQAHFAQAKALYNGAFIDYGIGNLFFDQMDIPVVGTRREFLDRHVFYNGRYLGVELLTAMLEDYARPRPMTPVERNDFLTFIFNESGWGEMVPTLTPTPTRTPYPPTKTPVP